MPGWRHLPTVYLGQVMDLYQPGITKNMGLDLLMLLDLKSDWGTSGFAETRFKKYQDHLAFQTRFNSWTCSMASCFSPEISRPPATFPPCISWCISHLIGVNSSAKVLWCPMMITIAMNHGLAISCDTTTSVDTLSIVSLTRHGP